MELLDWINDELTILAEAFGEPLTEERQEIYCAGLADISKDRLQTCFRRARYELKWFPKLAELRELAGALPSEIADGRPGPEEAWARMPKGERMDEDSVVWCEEERIAYGACRSLLREGDHIGARMAFKERYEKELAEVRSQRRPAQWTLSAGYDMNHRLATLATAVQEKRLSLEKALNFVPGERQNYFAQMLPPAQGKGLLTGRVEKLHDIPGLPGILAKMQMQGIVPDELKPETRPSKTRPSEHSSEEWHQRREDLKAQAEFLKRS
ncbi:MAG TPA: hypothetical protein VFO39_16305 [Candidatus Sulfotelmatobacter sp.]|nr:hypothetical protein [Candidatus Sulfotelmatobacter sp.]